MKKLITILIAGLITLASYSQSGVAHFTGIQLGTAPVAYNLASTADYVIETVGSTCYARPGTGTGLTAYSGSTLTTVLQNAQNALTNGGLICIRYAIYSGMDSVAITHDNITIRGIGRRPVLRAKNAFDVGRTWGTALIALNNAKDCRIENIELDGNFANQTRIDDNNAGNGMYGNFSGINGSYWKAGQGAAYAPDRFTLDNCYIHDFTAGGITVNYCDRVVIKNSIFLNNASNQVTTGHASTNTLIYNCLCTGGADVQISLYGTDNIAENCIGRQCNGSYGTTGSKVGGCFEGAVSFRNKFINCDFSGTGNLIGIAGNNAAEPQKSCEIISCLIHDIGGVGISLGRDSATVIRDTKIQNITGNALMIHHSRALKVIDTYISSPASIYGVWSAYGSRNMTFDNLNVENIHGGAEGSGYGIWLLNDTSSVIKNSSITTTQSYPLMMKGCSGTVLQNNIFTHPTKAGASAIAAVYIDHDASNVGTTSCIFKNNIIINTDSYAVNIQHLCSSNVFLDNITTGSVADYNNDATLTGATQTIFSNNLGVGNFLPSTGLFMQKARTATSDGLGNGIIVPGNQNLTVTSNTNDIYIISLPEASASTIGTKITGILVGAKICELRVQAAQATTVYINGITTNVEAAIPAGSSFEVIQIDATHWILKAWTALGAVITAIVPDAV